MNINTLMKKKVFSVRQGETLQEAARLMWEHDCGALPVIDDNDVVVGMITDRDIAMAAFLQGQSLLQLCVKSTMSKALFAVSEDQPLEYAERMMRLNQIRRLPVVDNQQRLVGIVSLNDLAEGYSASRGKFVKANELADTLADVCKRRAIEEGVAA